MYTPKWFDYSAKCHDELTYINRASNSPFKFIVKQHPSKPQTASLWAEIGGTPPVQLSEYMSFKRLYYNRINPLHESVYAYANGYRGGFTLKGVT